jgi:hypothetical protein
VNVLGRQYHVTGAPMDGSAIDNHNRKVYEEILKVIKMGWTQETVQYKGEYYQIPYPYEEGIRRWPVAEWTWTYSAPGEVDDKGVIRRICVVPKPYQQPHSRLFEPFSVGETTIKYTASPNIVPWILVAYPPDFDDFASLSRGRQRKPVEICGSAKASGPSRGALRPPLHEEMRQLEMFATHIIPPSAQACCRARSETFPPGVAGPTELAGFRPALDWPSSYRGFVPLAEVTRAVRLLPRRGHHTSQQAEEGSVGESICGGEVSPVRATSSISPPSQNPRR